MNAETAFATFLSENSYPGVTPENITDWGVIIGDPDLRPPTQSYITMTVAGDGNQGGATHLGIIITDSNAS